MLLMRVLIMEFNALLFPARYPTRWGLKEAFMALRKVGALSCCVRKELFVQRI